MAKKQSLGRGFDALIPKELDRSMLEEDKHRVQRLLIADIVPNPEQPRREHADDTHKELTESVKRHGVLQPIIVVRRKNGYRIVAGERRWRAAKAAGLENIPAVVRSLQELEEVELALIENIQRVDLSPLEQAMAVYKLQQQFNLGLEEIAQKLGKAASTISNLTRLLQLPEEAREALAEGKISEGHARAILALSKQPDKQKRLLGSILNNGWSVRQAEQFAIGLKSGSTTAKAAKRTDSESGLTRQIAQNLGAKVNLRHTAKGGQLIIHFNNDQELQKIADRILNPEN
ncbi:MAG TPA: ParB/RepB/Spo0J family partition protein [Candidatus Saccharimonadales bacterium]|nr:ParB/RepB/Spo0J family partition protein [Candidatus Saccharimonadales bacterium]